MFRKNLLRTFTVAAILFATVSSYALSEFASDEWRYDADELRSTSYFFGFQGGYNVSNWNDISNGFEGIGFTADVSEPTYAGRLFAGCYFSKFFGVEMGWLHISGASYTFRNIIPPLDTTTPRFFLANTITGNIVDLTMNTHVPLANNFEYYAKLGLAYGHYKNAFAYEPRDNSVSGRDQANTALTFGMGLDYCWSRHIAVGLAWQFYRGNDEIKSFIADTNFFSMSIAYITG